MWCEWVQYIAVTDSGIAGGGEPRLQGTVQVVVSETRASKYLKDGVKVPPNIHVQTPKVACLLMRDVRTGERRGREEGEGRKGWGGEGRDGRRRDRRQGRDAWCVGEIPGQGSTHSSS